MSSPYPHKITQLSSTELYKLGPDIIKGFNSVLTNEIDVVVCADEDDVQKSYKFKEQRIQFGLTHYGVYLATLMNVRELFFKTEDRLTPVIFDTLLNAESPNNQEENSDALSFLLHSNMPAMAFSNEEFNLPLDISAEVSLHPKLVSCGLLSSTVIIPPGFKGELRLPIVNLNPRLLVRLYKGHGFFACKFFRHEYKAELIGEEY